MNSKPSPIPTTLKSAPSAVTTAPVATLAVSIDQIKKVAPHSKFDLAQAVVDAVSDGSFAKVGITNAQRFSHFMSQILHESGGLTIREESLNYRSPERIMKIFGVGNHSARVTWDEARALVGKPEALAERVYGIKSAKSRDLGNTEPGDGWRFRGSGPIQITGRSIYREMTKMLRKLFGVPTESADEEFDLEANPELARTPRIGILVALAFWHQRQLNDEADRDDILTITKRINGGRNGLEDRRQYLQKCKAVFKDGQVLKGLYIDARGPRVKALQELLSLKGYPLLADGVFGQQTRRVVIAFQIDQGLEPDGIVDDHVWNVLEKAEPIVRSREEDGMQDLRERGSRIVTEADKSQVIAVGTAITGVGGALKTATENVEAVKSAANSITETIPLITIIIEFASNNWWLLALGAGFALYKFSDKIKIARLNDHRNYKTV